jgi:hypothetical protein
MTQPNNLLAKLFQGVGVVAIAVLFVGLGFLAAATCCRFEKQV